MFAELKVLNDPYAGRRAVAVAGQTLRVGRLRRDNQFSLPDQLLAPVHFELISDGAAWWVRDLSRGVQKHASCEAGCFLESLRNTPCRGICRIHDRSSENGLYINAAKVDSALVRSGDILMAGTTCFTLTLGDSPLEAPRSPVTPPPEKLALTLQQQARALEFFAQQKLPLYAVLDAARDLVVLETLAVHDAVYYSLYEGVEGEKLAEVAPYLVQLNGRSQLTEVLIREHWGKSLGFFLYALTDFKALRRHLRHFLMVEDERGKRMYFRYYDPRVLRVFLPTCTAAEATGFFGPIGSFLIEADEPAHAWLCNREPGYPPRLEDLAF